MSDSVIIAENISKRYRLGVRANGSKTFAGQLLNVITTPVQNFKRLTKLSSFAEDDDSVFWALKDINFAVKRGQVLGIVGRNGAGKSTLLKILSRITDPTTGTIKIEGRVASLLEVGTGFHPELTGRENVYMNGTILGMRRKEIEQKFDEIVDFSGVEKFVDTPVKFYSSGMKVRLGFAVAAHLEPEILIVDEVLAVGDAEFQKKCLGKMQDVSKHGRTVLFVSHNMSAVNALCQKGLLLTKGKIEYHGDIDKAISLYLDHNEGQFGKVTFDDQKDFQRNGDRIYGEFLSISTSNENDQVIDTFEFGKQINISLKLRIKQKVNNPEIGVCISTLKGARLHHLVSKWEREFGELEVGIYN